MPEFASLPEQEGEGDLCRMLVMDEVVQALKDCEALVMDDDQEGRLRRIKASVFLDAISQHRLSSATSVFRLDYGANPGGVFGAFPTDVMHALLEGVMAYGMETLFKQLLKGSLCADVDLLAIRCFVRASKQKGREEYPRMSYVGGITQTTMLAAHEYGGLYLAMALLLLPGHEDSMFHVNVSKGCVAVGDNLMSYVRLFTGMLSFVRWTKEGPFPRDEDSLLQVRYGINRLLKEMCELLPREEANGWDLQKLHDITHLWWCILMFGSPENYDNSPTEHNHKDLKMNARRALQHSEETYRLGTSVRLTESLALHKARLHLDMSFDYLPPKVTAGVSGPITESMNCRKNTASRSNDDGSDDEENENEEDQGSLSVWPFCVVVIFPATQNHSSNGNKKRSNADSLGVADNTVWVFPVENKKIFFEQNCPHLLHPTVLEALSKEMADQGCGASFVYEGCRREASDRKKVFFRARESFRGGLSWYDWVWVDWEIPESERHQYIFPSQREVADNGVILLPNNCEEVTRNGTKEFHYTKFSCPARLLCFYRTSRAGVLTAENYKAVILDVIRSGNFANLDPQRALVHSTKSVCDEDVFIGNRYQLECEEIKGSKGVDSGFKFKPKYRIIETSCIGDHLFCYEYSGVLRSYYKKQPYVVQVCKWRQGISRFFWENFVK